MAEPDNHTSRELVESLVKLFATPPDARPAHAKGFCCTGVFRPTPKATTLTRAVHMTRPETEVIVRFSNGAGNPTFPDAAPDLRGMAVRFKISKTEWTDLLSTTIPIFPARVPRDFLAFIQALMPDPATHGPDPKKVEAFVRAHPKLEAAVKFMTSPSVLASYAQATYWPIHAFRFINEHREERYVRYTWRPDASTVVAPDRPGRDPNYLAMELRDRLATQTVVFNLYVQIAEAKNGIVDDPSQLWPERWPSERIGTLEIDRVVNDQTKGCEALAFDPTHLTDGIALSDDPILRARAGVYALSVKRRMPP